jgi:L-threonylcarbamoyladenylate synthase
LKKRDRSKPLSVVVSDSEMVRAIAVEIPPVFSDLQAEFWPGPLTLVLKAGPIVPAALLGSKKTIGVRIPACVWLRRLIRTAGFPVTATSANLSGEGEVTSAEQAILIFRGKVDAIVDGGLAPGRFPSTVLDLTQKNPTVIREGAVSLSRLKKYLTGLNYS